MTNANNYPYELKEIFTISLEFHRQNEIPTPVELPISSEIKLIESGFPRLQINMRISTAQEGAITFNIELVGLFDYIGESPEYDKELNKEFVSEKALHMLWVYGVQIIRIITGQMGMNPIQMKVPISFPILQQQQ